MNYKFDCSCEVEIKDPKIKPMDGLPSLYIDYYNLPDCKETWGLIGTGRTKGIFQLESNLGQSWAKRIMPTSISEMAALSSVIRPGVLKAMLDDKSLTQHYRDRKFAEEEIEYFHEALEPILRETYSILVYQEQALLISKRVAGFSLQEAELLRKAIGKKLPEVMAEIKSKFLEGCKKTGIVNIEEAEEIFGWIEKSQRYSFNKSHGVEYGALGYCTAWVKHHFPFHFFTSWLKYESDEKERVQLISDSKYFNVEVCPPLILRLNPDFSMWKDKVRFGLNNIKGIGLAQSKKLLDIIKETEEQIGKNIKEWSWAEILTYLDLGSKTINGLIQVGAFSHLNLSRTQLLHEYSIWSKLNKSEKDFIRKNLKGSSVVNLMTQLIDQRKSNTKRKEKLNALIDSLLNPSSPLEDTPYKITMWEKDLLGVPITYSKLDNCDDDVVGLANTTCREFLDGKTGNVIIAGELIRISEYKTKNGDMMGFLTLEDATGAIDMIAFADLWAENQHRFFEGNTVLIWGYRSNRGGLIIKNAKNI